MLVLARELSQRIMITSPNGDRITLTIVEVRGNKVRIGIDGPKDWTFHREEIQKQVDAEKNG